MKDSNCVVVQAADGHAKQLADLYDVSLTRMYEILGKDNPYPKLLKLLRTLANERCNPAGVREIQADLNARIDRMLSPVEREPSVASIHDECADVTSAKLRGVDLQTRKKEVLQAISVLTRELKCIQDAEESGQNVVESLLDQIVVEVTQ